MFFCLYNEAFPKQKIKIKPKIFHSPWMTIGLVKPWKKKQILHEKSEERKHEEELNYKQYKTVFQLLKKKSKKKYYSDLID